METSSRCEPCDVCTCVDFNVFRPLTPCDVVQLFLVASIYWCDKLFLCFCLSDMSVLC